MDKQISRKHKELLEKNFSEALENCSKCSDVSPQDECSQLCAFKLIFNSFMVKNQTFSEII